MADETLNVAEAAVLLKVAEKAVDTVAQNVEGAGARSAHVQQENLLSPHS